MYERMKLSTEDNVLCLKLREGLSGKEHEELERLLEQEARKSGRIRLLLIFEPYRGGGRAVSLYEDLRFVKLAADKIERLAVVGDGAQQETSIALFGLFGGVETAYFRQGETDKALAWLVRGA